MPDSMLQGVRVLDISQGIAGPFCARLLGDYGADVIKIEPVGGDSQRRAGPFFHDEVDLEKSLFFLVLNVNKRGITLNLESKEGRALFLKLAEKADVVIESFKPGYLDKLGIGYKTLKKRNPEIVLTSITPFGQTGPYAQFEGEEIVYYAMGGVMAVSGATNREPLKHGGSPAQYEGGLAASVATAFALVGATLEGTGQHVDVSVTEVVSSTLVGNMPYYSFTGGIQGRISPDARKLGQSLMECKDGYVFTQISYGGATWDVIADFFGSPTLKEPRFADPNQRPDHGEEMDKLILEALKKKSKWDLFTEAAKNRMLFGIVQDPRDLVNCPQMASRGFYQETDHPVMGVLKVPGILVNFSDTPYELRRSAPLLGQHNEEVYVEELGYSRSDVVKLRALGVL